jgi:hypothetical protein
MRRVILIVTIFLVAATELTVLNSVGDLWLIKPENSQISKKHERQTSIYLKQETRTGVYEVCLFIGGVGNNGVLR